MIQRCFFAAGLLLLLIFTHGRCAAQNADEESGMKLVLSKLEQSDPALAKEFERRLKQSQGEVDQFKKGHVIFGRIKLDESDDPRSVVSQMIVLKGGFFIDAIGEAGRPVGFRVHGYESVVVTPQGPGPIENLGVIQMKRLPADRLVSANGQLKMEPHAEAPKLDQVTVSWQFPCDPINTPHNGTEGIITKFYPAIHSKGTADGKFEITGMSPGKYRLHVTAANCVQQFRDVELAEGKANEIAPIEMELARQMNVEYAVSKDGDFTDLKFKKASLKADDRWRASEETPTYGFDLLIGQKNSKLLFDYRYGPCHIQDLGKAQVTDELEVDLDKLEARQPQNVPIEEGHVYVILQSSWKHWILVRTTQVGAIPNLKPE